MNAHCTCRDCETAVNTCNLHSNGPHLHLESAYTARQALAIPESYPELSVTVVCGFTYTSDDSLMKLNYWSHISRVNTNPKLISSVVSLSQHVEREELQLRSNQQTTWWISLSDNYIFVHRRIVNKIELVYPPSEKLAPIYIAMPTHKKHPDQINFELTDYKVKFKYSTGHLLRGCDD